MLEEPRLAAIGRIKAGRIDLERLRQIGDAHAVIAPLVKQALCLLDAELPIERPPRPPLADIFAHWDLLKTTEIIVFAIKICNAPLRTANSDHYYSG
jgi:hypothetical protein